ncbi:Na+/H+ antiporter NhaC [Halobacillus andaensis]|uniref:Na+/H+ antiporter NhaC n=1 Tax=Halobacillus andaensis TaxID=1176239 RepID=A0A917EU74_HALAA|nr:Na+/H+ antiporter NhaC [Halobacillus andaensis]MBP2003905.1 NhaC family Na+:H+ antiporter [Halobacillus andaensis]GGF14185.1 Na+/H+ antiporter NhaC [Halobacillus andaensis]
MEKRIPSFAMSLIVFLTVVAILGVSILIFEAAPHIPIVLVAVIVTLYGFKLGYSWKELEKAITKGVSHGVPAILILSLIGILVGVWVLNGTVQTITFYGLHVLSPSIFLVSAVIITAVVATMTGSSWSAISTIGIALMGVSYGMEISPAMTAGAIVCGAIFGDKMSPLSDTTNLTAATAKVDIFQHIKHMLWTTVPSLLITLIIFGVISFMTTQDTASTGNVEAMISTLNSEYNLTPIALISPLLIIVLAFRRVSSIPALVIGLIAAVATTFYTVPGVTFGEIMSTAHFGYTAETGDEAIDSLLSLGGLDSMLFGVSLILIALSFGGIIKEIGIAHAIIDGMRNFLKSRGNVVLSTVLSCLGVNVAVGEQYLSIILPGQMLEDSYKNANLHPKNLSRTLEDAGTIIHPLIPWGVTGVFIMSTLNIGMGYIPYAFICFITPVIAIIYGYTGFALPPLNEDAVSYEEPMLEKDA